MSENLVKIGVVVSEISLHQAIVKKEEERKNRKESNSGKTKACRLKPGGLINIFLKNKTPMLLNITMYSKLLSIYIRHFQTLRKKSPRVLIIFEYSQPIQLKQASDSKVK